MKARFILSALLLAASPGAQAIDFGVGVKAGTVGYGADLSFVLTETINIRASFTQADFSESDTIDINDANNTALVDAKLDLDFGSTALLIDWYVFDGTFHVTAGMMKNDSTMNLNGTIVGVNGASSVDINGTTYSLSDFADASVGGNLSFGDSFEPYLGIGWGRKADASDPGLSLSFEIGVVAMDPKIDFNQYPTLTPAALAVPGAPTQAELQADIDAAEATANADLDEYELYPVVSLGLNYAF